MNIYKGLMFLDGFRVLPEDADDAATAAVPSAPTSRPAPSPAPRRAAAGSGWQRRLRAIAAAAGVMPADTRPGCCG
ncbi:hypothetical protein [Lysobacter sp. F6437]|uniref:hypothetical protein n=1 Tax=Lysobacter sp. F6437 TaxID=3459296 RepID=UPI00403DC38B